MPIPTQEDYRLGEIENAADMVMLKLSVMRRAKKPQEHRAELRQKLQTLVDLAMQFADAIER
jgi:hypothetical protein